MRDMIKKCIIGGIGLSIMIYMSGLPEPTGALSRPYSLGEERYLNYSVQNSSQVTIEHEPIKQKDETSVNPLKDEIQGQASDNLCECKFDI